MNTKSLPLVAITMGDAAGTGPEIITKSLALPELRAVCRPVVIGDAAAMTRALRFTGVSLKIRALKDVAEATSAPGEIDVLDLANLDLATLKLGHVDPQAGHAAYEYIKLATELALAGRVSAVVTSINKESLNAAGHHFDGHTGLLAHLCDRPDATMMLVADKLRVSHVSTHVPLRVAIDRVKPDRILTVLRLTHDAVRRLGIDRPASPSPVLIPMPVKTVSLATKRKNSSPPPSCKPALSAWMFMALSPATRFSSARSRASSTPASPCITTKATSPPRCSASGAG